MAEDEILSVLKQACLERRACRTKFLKDPGPRTILPHGVGFTSKNKKIIVCVQVGGYTGSQSLPQFRNLQFHSCEWIEMLERRFSVDPNFNPQDTQYKHWLFHV
jgi:hypothetical protein